MTRAVKRYLKARAAAEALRVTLEHYVAEQGVALQSMKGGDLGVIQRAPENPYVAQVRVKVVSREKVAS